MHDRRVMSEESIRTLDKDKREALVIEASTPAVIVRMTRHYEGPDKDLYAASVAKTSAIVGSSQPNQAAS